MSIWIPMLRAALLSTLLALSALAGPKANWSGPYQPCLNSTEFLKSGHMDLGVRFDSSSPAAADALRRALKFWSTVIDMDFHEDSSRSCSLALVDATPEILSENNDVARAQFTDWTNFQGWIAFDPHMGEYVSADEIYATAVHELGHMFGLLHNSNPSSVMFYIDADGSSVLEDSDIAAVATRHALRPDVRRGPIPVL
jgi:hypothetical protein